MLRAHFEGEETTANGAAMQNLEACPMLGGRQPVTQHTCIMRVAKTVPPSTTTVPPPVKRRTTGTRRCSTSGPSSSSWTFLRGGRIVGDRLLHGLVASEGR